MASTTYTHEDETTGLLIGFDVDAKLTKGDDGDYFTPPDPGHVNITSVMLVSMTANGIPIGLSEDARNEIQDAFHGMLNAKGKDADELRDSVYNALWKSDEDNTAYLAEQARDRRRETEAAFLADPSDDDCPW